MNSILSDANIRPMVTVQLEGRILTFNGREAWALQHLKGAGEKGVTPIERPAPRWSHYIRQLRLAGIEIETRIERHGGPYSGNHGRYVLRSEISVLDSPEAPEAA